MNCTICRKPIQLVPSAAERAEKFGGRPSDYTRAFTEHAACTVTKRSRESADLARRIAQFQERSDRMDRNARLARQQVGGTIGTLENL